MKKIALFAFNGEAMCFVHVLLNALSLKDNGYEVKIIIEGSAVKLVPELVKTGSPLTGPWQKVLAAGLIAGVCKACAAKLGTLDAAIEQGLPLLNDMAGHPSMAPYLKEGYEIITF
jgi:hypothetical protein